MTDMWKKFQASLARKKESFLRLDTGSMQSFAEDLLKRDGRLYIGMNEQGQQEAFFVACPRGSGMDFDVDAAIEAGEATVYDVTNPCPPICP